MGLLREKSPKNHMNTGLFGSRSGEYGLVVTADSFLGGPDMTAGSSGGFG